MKSLKYIFLLILLLSFLLISPKTILAVEDPLAIPNNKFGIHIIDENDLTNASSLVNSQGGDWGYITIVIREDERNHLRWQNAFNKMRRLHLIPIVRIASKQENGGWSKPTHAEINNWIAFLNNLNWVTQNRYVIIGNEPNHSAEWGGEVNPEEYADYLIAFSEKLKLASEDFFILPAALDASAPNDKKHMSEYNYLKQMVRHNKLVFDYVDGWNSHSYPNPNFSGSEDASGRGTVRTFEWELSYLKFLGIEKDLPVFITETGWAHDMEEKSPKLKNSSGPEAKSPNEISEKLKIAYKNAWNNEKIVAITPFILNYQGEPFDVFSWIKQDGSFYDFFYSVQNIAKTRGVPIQINSIKTIRKIFPEIIRRKGDKWGLAYIENTGQVIWNVAEIQTVKESEKKYEIEPISFLSTLEPGSKTLALTKKDRPLKRDGP